MKTRPVFDGAEVPRIAAGLTDWWSWPDLSRADDGFPTRTAKIALIAEALDCGIPTLGVCLGAQLLAAASAIEGDDAVVHYLSIGQDELAQRAGRLRSPSRG